MNFTRAVIEAREALKQRSAIVHPDKWQSVDVSNKPDMATHELLNWSFTVPVRTENLHELRKDIKPNLPWADDHFLERVSGQPLNPGEEWKNWPYAHSADRFRTEKGGKFSHTYMERMWPKKADAAGNLGEYQMFGIRYNYGDAGDVVNHLVQSPLSRQAFLPIWFPEDTGKTEVRVPCTLGYHFIHRHGHLHIVYYIRSCDVIRHFQDDIYLTVRLQLWMLDQLRAKDSETWGKVKPGLYTMHITSLHCFRNDFKLL